MERWKVPFSRCRISVLVGWYFAPLSTWTTDETSESGLMKCLQVDPSTWSDIKAQNMCLKSWEIRQTSKERNSTTDEYVHEFGIAEEQSQLRQMKSKRDWHHRIRCHFFEKNKDYLWEKWETEETWLVVTIDLMLCGIDVRMNTKIIIRSSKKKEMVDPGSFWYDSTISK